MPSSKQTYDLPSARPSLGVKEEQLEYGFIGKLQGLKYEYRPDIRDRASLERNFREKFEALNRVHLSDGEFARLLDEIVTPDVYTAARTLRERNAFTRDDGTPLNYTLVNIKDWCKNSFEVVNQLRINSDYSHHRYDVLILINGVPCVQVELKTLGISPRRAMEQIVGYKNDPGNGYSRTLLCFLQLFIVTNRTDTWYFANNNARHFYAYHFNVLRGILDKTATFFGNDDFGVCVHGLDDDELLNLASHETYSVYQPVELVEDNKRLFKQILDAFLQRYQFELPDIFASPAAKRAEAPAAGQL